MKVVVEGMLLAAVGLLKADYNGVCVCCSGGGGGKRSAVCVVGQSIRLPRLAVFPLCDLE